MGSQETALGAILLTQQLSIDQHASFRPRVVVTKAD